MWVLAGTACRPRPSWHRTHSLSYLEVPRVITWRVLSCRGYWNLIRNTSVALWLNAKGLGPSHHHRRWWWLSLISTRRTTLYLSQDASTVTSVAHGHGMLGTSGAPTRSPVQGSVPEWARNGHCGYFILFDQESGVPGLQIPYALLMNENPINNQFAREENYFVFIRNQWANEPSNVF